MMKHKALGVIVAASAAVLAVAAVAGGERSHEPVPAGIARRPRLPLAAAVESNEQALPLLPVVWTLRFTNTSGQDVVMTPYDHWPFSWVTVILTDHDQHASDMERAGMHHYAFELASPLPNANTIRIRTGESIRVPVQLRSWFVPRNHGRPSLTKSDSWPPGRYHLAIAFDPASDRNFTIGGRRPAKRAVAVSEPFELVVTEPTEPRLLAAYRLYRDAGISREQIHGPDILDPKALALALLAQRTALDRYLWNRIEGHQQRRIRWELEHLEQGRLINTFSAKNQVPFTSLEFGKHFRDWFAWLLPGPALEQAVGLDQTGLSADDQALLARLTDWPAARRNRLLLGLAYPGMLTPSPDLVRLRYADTPYGRL